MNKWVHITVISNVVSRTVLLIKFENFENSFVVMRIVLVYKLLCSFQIDYNKFAIVLYFYA